MTTPGDDDQTPPPSPPPPLDPFRHPIGGHVDRPEFADGGSGPYSPDYDPTAPPTGPAAASADRPPIPQPSPLDLAEPRPRDSRWGLMAPIAAAIVLVGGIGILIVSSGSDEPETTNTPRIAEVRDPDEPLVESTVPGDSVVEPSLPNQTSPPLIEPTTIPSDPPTSTSPPPTLAPDTGGPTQTQLEAALLTIDEIGAGPWTEEEIDLEDVCGVPADEAVPDFRVDSLFQEIVLETGAVRQIHNALFTFPDATTAERAFTDEIDVLVGCNATTIDLEGLEYRIQVDNDAFTDEQAAEFPCADQSAFLIIQLFNESSPVPYIGQSAVSFRCGRNITITELTTTLDIDDLTDEDFFNAAGASNIRTGALPGS